MSDGLDDCYAGLNEAERLALHSSLAAVAALPASTERDRRHRERLRRLLATLKP
jgi:hypothetical protein